MKLKFHSLMLAIGGLFSLLAEAFLTQMGAIRYANTITSLIPTIFEAMDTVSRELVGMIPSVALSPAAERAAINQTITAHIAPAAAATDVTPGVAPPDDGDQAIGNVQMSITKARRVPVRWNGEQSLSLDSPGGITRGAVMKDQFEQAFRTLSNEMETDLAALHLEACAAAGVAGTTPFGFSTTASGFEALTEARKALVDRGSPTGQLQLVLGTTAGAKLRSIGQLNRIDASGTDAFMKQGILIPLQGMDIRESAKIVGPVTKGTAAGSTTNAAGYALGATVITLASAGTGTFVVGDFVSFAGDTNQYMVTSGDADVSTGGAITLSEPGLLKAIPASATAITVSGNSVRNMAFHRNAIVLATRLPARPKEGDLAIDVTSVTDPRSGLTFEIAMYPQYRQMQYEVSIAWGIKAVKKAHIVALLG